VLEIGRIRMPDMFDLTWDKPKPLVPRRHRMEVTERLAGDGSVVTPLAEADVVDAGQALVDAGIAASSRFVKAGGYMLKVPAIDVAEVGAGGGSNDH